MDVPYIRSAFPFMREHPAARYLDSAAMTQVPDAVIDATVRALAERSNPHRGMYPLAERVTEAYESARSTVRRFIGARTPSEIVFTRNCTEAINIVARSWAQETLQAGDVVVLTVLEHHSNIVPWQQLASRIGVVLTWIDCDDAGVLDLDALDEVLVGGRVKLVSVTGLSNVLGVQPQLTEIIRRAHAVGARVCVDAAQLVAHQPVDVRALDCDFLAFSGYKLYGPTGIGVLYAKSELLASMPPVMGGGMMIQEVRRDGFIPADPPARFEAGTPPYVEAVGLAAAIDWLSQFSWQDVVAHERDVLAAALDELRSTPGVRILGPGKADAITGCISFTVDGVHPHDLTALLGERGYMLRAGHHCAQPLHRRLGIGASARIAIGIYNTEEDVRGLGAAIADAARTFAR
ncbi:MAG: cysteine desulfurase / selenocysteine lyase [Candidatus Peregrinibacteria bacterium Gr01-1014_25]|nr:MAG: cysteine desulfurase / selenocysteine lyase [Candidatus Peregrinibacteria bacterium Gr01-1014_25]